jgi:quercetin dioxygenase-like cupin family protein
MRALLSFLAMTALAAGPALAQDPVVVDPDHYSVVFENDQVRVLRITYGPNEASVMHDHPAGVAVYLNDLHGRFTMPDGQTVENSGKAGDAIWTEAGAHLPENLSDQPFELILVEMKSPAAPSGE